METNKPLDSRLSEDYSLNSNSRLYLKEAGKWARILSGIQVFLLLIYAFRFVVQLPRNVFTPTMFMYFTISLTTMVCGFWAAYSFQNFGIKMQRASWTGEADDYTAALYHLKMGFQIIAVLTILFFGLGISSLILETGFGYRVF